MFLIQSSSLLLKLVYEGADITGYGVWNIDPDKYTAVRNPSKVPVIPEDASELRVTHVGKREPTPDSKTLVLLQQKQGTIGSTKIRQLGLVGFVIVATR